MATGPVSDPLGAATEAVDLAQSVVANGVAALATAGGVDVDQAVAYDLAHAASAAVVARSMLDYGTRGDTERDLTCAFVAEVLVDLAGRVAGRERSEERHAGLSRMPSSA